jgi:hypothetical protein
VELKCFNPGTGVLFLAIQENRVRVIKPFNFLFYLHTDRNV